MNSHFVSCRMFSADYQSSFSSFSPEIFFPKRQDKGRRFFASLNHSAIDSLISWTLKKPSFTVCYCLQPSFPHSLPPSFLLFCSLPWGLKVKKEGEEKFSLPSHAFVMKLRRLFFALRCKSGDIKRREDQVCKCVLTVQ